MHSSILEERFSAIRKVSPDYDYYSTLNDFKNMCLVHESSSSKVLLSLAAAAAPFST